MRSGALRAFSGCALVLAAALAAGCSSATKRHYLHHLSITIAPAPEGSEMVAAFEADRQLPAGAVAAAQMDERAP